MKYQKEAEESPSITDAPRVQGDATAKYPRCRDDGRVVVIPQWFTSKRVALVVVTVGHSR